MFFAEVIVRNSAIAALVYFLSMVLPERKEDPPGIYEKHVQEMYDYIVVGAGSAGSIVATRLSEDYENSVLLLEAGKSDLEPDDVTQIPSLWYSLIGSEKDWGYHSVPQKYSHFAYKNEKLHSTRQSAWGSSSINSINILRGSRNNYDQWKQEGAFGWGYDDVLPYFRKLENATETSYKDSSLRGRHGPIVIKENTGSILQSFHNTAAMAIGFPTVDCNSDYPIGFCKSQTNIKDGKRCSTSTCYLRPVLQRCNLQVNLRSQVSKVLIRNNKAVGVEFVKDGKKRLVFAKHEVILSAGVIGSAQILMLSGVGPRRHLQQMKIPLKVDLPVGQNLYDHLNFIVQYNITAPLSINNKKAAEPDRILDYIFNRKGIYSRNGAEGSILQDVNPQDARGPQIELQLSNIAYEEGLVLDPNVAFKNEIVKEHLKRVGPNSFVVVMFLLQPRSKGYLRLSSKSPFTYPVIDPRYLSHPEDIEDFVRGIRLMRSLEQTEAWKSIGATLVRQDIPGHCSEEIYDSDNYWRCVGRHFLRSAYHFVGTCRMGSVNDPSVVVDSRLRVIGIDRLRVVDASVMRYIPSGHTNAPAMMIGEKAADMIKRDKTLCLK